MLTEYSILPLTSAPSCINFSCCRKKRSKPFDDWPFEPSVGELPYLELCLCSKLETGIGACLGTGLGAGLGIVLGPLEAFVADHIGGEAVGLLLAMSDN